MHKCVESSYRVKRGEMKIQIGFSNKFWELTPMGLIHFPALLLSHYCYYILTSFCLSQYTWYNIIFDMKISRSGLSKQLPKIFRKYCITFYCHRCSVLQCTYRASKTSIRYTQKRVPKINSDVCFTKIL